MLRALDELAAANEVLIIAQDVENDSILGSQMLPYESNKDDQAAMYFTQPFELDTDDE